MFRPALFHSIVLGCLSLLLFGCGDKKAALEKKYQTALEQLETGDADARNEARLTIASLAGFHEERPQHAGAHRWMGLDLFSKSDPRRPREARETLALAERHLLRAIEMDGGVVGGSAHDLEAEFVVLRRELLGELHRGLFHERLIAAEKGVNGGIGGSFGDHGSASIH
jgi:hypothetical protein